MFKLGGCKLEFHSSAASVNGKPEHVVIVAHSKEALGAALPAQLDASLAPGAAQFLKYMAEKTVSPGKEKSASGHTLVPLDASSFQKVTLCLLPTKKPSRHAAPGYPFEVTKLVKSACGSKDASVFLLLGNPEQETFSVCCAIARAFPTFTMKNQSKPKDESAISRIDVYTGTTSTLFAGNGISIDVGDVQSVADSLREISGLGDAPPNLFNVSEYVNHVQAVAKDLPGVTVKVIRGEELQALGAGGLYGVGKASDDPPAMVILSHGATADNAPSITFVGKGITYDTGGLSIKTKTGMPGMKHDKLGSLGCFGAFCSIVRRGGLANQVPLHCVLCIAENSVASNATRPDDVHLFLSGKTAEINNTDAEGRLAMADGLAYSVKELNPAYLLNMATLTGAQSAASGLKHAAIFTNSEAFETAALVAGKTSGDLVHPLPYIPEYLRDEFSSTCADMKNSQKNRSNLGSGCPAVFLSNHIEGYLEEDKPWLHIDMASPGTSGERATGYGVSLLFVLSRALAAQQSNL